MPPYNPLTIKSKRKWLLLTLIPLSIETMGEVKSGTAIVIFYSKQRVILASESRVTVFGKNVMGKDVVDSSDDDCKVITLNNRFLFAASGLVGHVHRKRETGISWSGYEEATKIAAKIPADTATSVPAFANQWGERMKTILDLELPENATQYMTRLRGTLLASGVFAGRTRDGELLVYVVTLYCACSDTEKRTEVHVNRYPPAPDNLPVAAFGPAEAVQVFFEVLDGKTDRAKAEQEAWNVAFPQDNSLAHDAGITIRTLEFMIKNSGAPEIGGPIDVAMMDSSGIHWIQRKANCRDN